MDMHHKDKETELVFIGRELDVLAQTGRDFKDLLTQIPDKYHFLMSQTFINNHTDLILMLNDRLKTLRGNK